MPISEHSISPAMVEADDRARVDVVNGQLLYRLVEGTAVLNGARAILRNRQRAAVALGLDVPGVRFHAAHVLGEPQHAAAHFLALHSIELFYKAVSRATVGKGDKGHRLRAAHDGLPFQVKRELERRFREIAARSSFAIRTVMDWVGAEPPGLADIPEPHDALTQHLAFLDATSWHLYKYSDERLSRDTGRAWGYFYERLEGWIEYAHFLRDRALEEARREGGEFAVSRVAMSSGYALPAGFLEVLDDT